jgi:NAD-dependent dihydropyrimidine dehydrogenase PreA subunit
MPHEETVNNNDNSPAPAPKKQKSRPKDLKIYKSWCKRCGICAALCPTGALEIGSDGHPVWKHPEKCIGCRMCEYRCPDFALEVISDEKNGAPENGWEE